jgi:hypothetical protein
LDAVIHAGFSMTEETPSRAVVHFYNKRGTAEQWIKEGKQAVKMTRLSCHRFRSNQVRLALSLLEMKKNRLLSAVKDHTIRSRWDKMEIPVNMDWQAQRAFFEFPQVRL